MKQGKSISELAKQLEDIKTNSRDWIIPTEKLSVSLDEIVAETEKARKVPVVTFTNGEEQRLHLNNWSNRQMAEYAAIPQAYYDRIQNENPELFVDSVNHGLRRQVALASQQGKPERRMVRSYRGSIRAILSDKFRRLDAYDMVNEVFPLMLQHGLEPVSTELTDRRMYIKAVTPRITAEVKVGDIVQFGMAASTSDVGSGSVRVEPLAYRLRCLNGMVMPSAIRKFHIGKTQGEDDIMELLSDETKQLSDAAFWAQVRDVITGSMKKEIFESFVDRLRVAANEPIKNFDIPRVIELASKATGVTNEGVKNSMVAYLANGADGAGLTKWGLANAFTHAAQDDDLTYDDATDLERAGSKIIDLTDKQWSLISSAPAN
jgi:hypothetical protein